MHLLKSRKQINMISKATISLLVITTAVYAQAPCSFPAQWEATEGILSGSSDDEGNSAITMGEIAISFDGKGKMIYMDETIVTGNMTKMYTILQFYNDGVQYFIENTTCTRSKLGPWADRDRVPADAKVVRQYSLGQNQSIMVTDYSFNVGQLTIVLSVTNDMCFPLIEEQLGQIQGVNILTAVGIQSPTLGIKNPTVFNIPDICKKDNVPRKAKMYRQEYSGFCDQYGPRSACACVEPDQDPHCAHYALVEVDWVERRIPFTR